MATLYPNTPTNTTIVRLTSVEDEEFQVENKKWPQYLAVLVATIGGFIVGTTIGWTDYSGTAIKNNQYSFQLTDKNISWINLCIPIGASLGHLVMAVTVDKIGRKTMMLLLTIPAFIGWATIIGAKSVVWIYAGRILIGFSSGSYSLIAPMYTDEIAEKEIIGILGTYFEKQVYIGAFFIYVLGYYINLFWLSTVCATIPVIYVFCLVAFVPESPVYYLMKGNVESARVSLKSLRGPFSNVDQELDIMLQSLANTESEIVSTMKTLQTRPSKRGLFLRLRVMYFQRFKGYKAVIFHATIIVLIFITTLSGIWSDSLKINE